MAFKLSSGYVSGFKFLFSLAIMYGLMSILAYSVVHMKFVKPLGADMPLDRFSEARAMEHLRALTKDIDGRQEGRPGLKEAAMYIKSQLEMLKVRAASNVSINAGSCKTDYRFWMGSPTSYYFSFQWCKRTFYADGTETSSSPDTVAAFRVEYQKRFEETFHTPWTLGTSSGSFEQHFHFVQHTPPFQPSTICACTNDQESSHNS